MTSSTNTVVQLSEYITLHRHHDGNLLEFQIETYSDQEATPFITTVYDHAAYCTEHEIPYLTMHCLTKFVPPTAHLREQISEWGRAYPHLKGRDVIVVPPSPLMMLMRILIPLMRFHQRNIERRIMQDREKAMAWLEELL